MISPVKSQVNLRLRLTADSIRLHRLHNLCKRFPLLSTSAVTLALPSRVTSSSINSSLQPLVPPTSSSLTGSAVDVDLGKAKAKASNVIVLPSTLTLPLSLHLLPQPPIKSCTLGRQALQSERSQKLLL